VFHNRTIITCIWHEKGALFNIHCRYNTKGSTRCKIKEPENHTQIKELFNRRQELEEEITKINAEMSALNQENLNNVCLVTPNTLLECSTIELLLHAYGTKKEPFLISTAGTIPRGVSIHLSPASICTLGGIKKQIGLHDTRESAIAKYEQIYEHKEFYINKFNKENSPAPYLSYTPRKNTIMSLWFNTSHLSLPKAVISENILRPSEFPQATLFTMRSI
jgi:hypothetical protein